MLENVDSLVTALRQAMAAGSAPEALQDLFNQVSGHEAAHVLDDLSLPEATDVFNSLPIPIAAHALTEVG